MRAHLYFYKSMSLFMTHLSCIEPARVHSKSWFGRDPILAKAELHLDDSNDGVTDGNSGRELDEQ